MLTLSVTNAEDKVMMVETFRFAINLLMYKKTLLANSLIDLGANLNVISWETWNAMGQLELTPSTLNFLGFSTVAIICLGILILKINVQDEPMYISFYVANVIEFVEHVILG